MDVYILNMPERQERRESVMKTFMGKNCFTLHIVTPISHPIPRVSHWLTFLHLTRKAKALGLDYFVSCEDDHVFTEHFDERQFLCTLYEADRLKADILTGGISWMFTPIQVSDHLFWLERFNGTQFVIVFSRFYNKILSVNWNDEKVVTDFHISANSENIFVIYPFISIQKEFGYSDVTSFNNKKGYVTRLFKETSNGLSILNRVKNFYHGLQ